MGTVAMQLGWCCQGLTAGHRPVAVASAALSACEWWCGWVGLFVFCTAGCMYCLCFAAVLSLCPRPHCGTFLSCSVLSGSLICLGLFVGRPSRSTFGRSMLALLMHLCCARSVCLKQFEASWMAICFHSLLADRFSGCCDAPHAKDPSCRKPNPGDHQTGPSGLHQFCHVYIPAHVC